jgi:hypothetical protein
MPACKKEVKDSGDRENQNDTVNLQNEGPKE